MISKPYLYFNYSSLIKVLGNASEFQRISDLLAVTLNFNVDINVSVFETNIRGESLEISQVELSILTTSFLKEQHKNR